MFLEILKFIFYSGVIVIISKYILVETLRKLSENLNLKASTIGKISGISTSIPELLTISISSIKGLSGVSIYNIISSNIINFIQYISTIFLNKNIDKFENIAIKTDLVLVLFTIVIPILLLFFNFQVNLAIIPLLIILYFFFNFLNANIHKVYLQKEDAQIEKNIIIEARLQKYKNIRTIKYIIILVFTGILLFIISDKLGSNIENLCSLFNIPEAVIGVLLGFITSVPELITFFESQKHHKKMSNEMLGVVEATNNLLTSNMINLFIVQSIGIILTNIYVILLK